MSFFDSEVVRAEMHEISQLQEEVYESIFQFPSMSREDKLNHVEMLERLLDKQKILYTRLSLSSDIEAKRMKEKIVESLKSNFGNLKSNEYDYKYDWDLKSIAYINDFDFKNGAVRVYCVNWSEATEKKRNFVDNLSVTIQINYFTEWLNNRIN